MSPSVQWGSSRTYLIGTVVRIKWECLAQCMAHSQCSVDSRWLILTLAQACVVVYLNNYWLACWEKRFLCSEVFWRPAGRWWETQLLLESLRCFSVLLSVFLPPRGPTSSGQSWSRCRSLSWGPAWRDGAICSTWKRHVLRQGPSWKSILIVDPKKILPGFMRTCQNLHTHGHFFPPIHIPCTSGQKPIPAGDILCA